MGEFENKSSFGEGKAEMSVELIDSLGEWALREGYSHLPRELQNYLLTINNINHSIY